MKKFLVSLFVLLIACTMLAAAQDLRNMQATTGGGEGHFNSTIREVVLDEVPAASAAEMSRHVTMLRPRDGRTDAQYAAMKQQAAMLAGNHAMATAGQVGPAPTSSQTFLSTTNAFIAQSENGSTPSDMAIAVGPTYVAQFVNTFIAVYTKTGVIQAGYPKSATAFFGLPAGTYTTDPRGVYDWTNGRYIFVMLTESSFTSNNVGQIMVAVSKTNNPTGGWNIIKLQVGNTGECPDYPTLGHDSNNWGKNGTKGAIYVGLNQFASNCKGAFINNYLFTFPKDRLYAGTGYYYWYQAGFTVNGTLVDTLSPANPQGPGDHPSAELITNSFNILWNCGAGCNGLTIWSENNVAAFTTGGPGPTFAGAVVPTSHTYYYAPQADQPGSAQSIETIDTRITGSMYYHAGDLFGSLETGAPGVPGAHPIWFDYHPLLNTSQNITGGDERQEDCFYCGGQGTNGSAYFATLIPDAENNLTMTYTYSDDNIYPEMTVTGRRVTYGDTFMNGAGYAIAGGTGLYSQGRWGDYSAVAPDNTKPAGVLMWTAGDYDASGIWGTAISAQSYLKPTDQ
ncbi:MAG TPA: hypothetical protein VKR60_00115 [Candidatus Sulfotelmatobacter sp.]|nr:hypothetical protein [Candidatus Sulfotelmatobacter sp.]